MTGDVLGDTRMYLSGHRLRSAPSGLVAVSASRALLEGHVRARVRPCHAFACWLAATSSA